MTFIKFNYTYCQNQLDNYIFHSYWPWTIPYGNKLFLSAFLITVASLLRELVTFVERFQSRFGLKLHFYWGWRIIRESYKKIIGWKQETNNVYRVSLMFYRPHPSTRPPPNGDFLAQVTLIPPTERDHNCNGTWTVSFFGDITGQDSLNDIFLGLIVFVSVFLLKLFTFPEECCWGNFSLSCHLLIWQSRWQRCG